MNSLDATDGFDPRSSPDGARAAAQTNESEHTKERLMTTHPFDAMSALLGIATIAGGAIVIGGSLDPLAGQDAGVWFTSAVLLGGVALLPWRRRRTRNTSDVNRDTSAHEA